MKLSELLKTAAWENEFLRAFVRNDDDNGLILDGPSLLKILNAIENSEGTSGPLVILKELAEYCPPGHPVMAVKMMDNKPLIYGCSLSLVNEVEIAEDGKENTSTIAGIFGQPIPEGISLQIGLESIGKEGEQYKRPTAKLSMQYTNSKGKGVLAVLEVKVANINNIEYREWADRCSSIKDLDENDLITNGLLGAWKAPALGGGGKKINLREIGEMGPGTYPIISVTYGDRQSKNGGTYQTSSLTLLINGEEYQTWAEPEWLLSAAPQKGGINCTSTVATMLSMGKPYFLHVKGVRNQTRWDKESKTYMVQISPDGVPYQCIDAVVNASPSQSLQSIQVLPPSEAPLTLKPAAIPAAIMVQEPDFGDIPF